VAAGYILYKLLFPFSSLQRNLTSAWARVHPCSSELDYCHSSLASSSWCFSSSVLRSADHRHCIAFWHHLGLVSILEFPLGYSYDSGLEVRLSLDASCFLARNHHDPSSHRTCHRHHIPRDLDRLAHACVDGRYVELVRRSWPSSLGDSW